MRPLVDSLTLSCANKRCAEAKSRGVPELTQIRSAEPMKDSKGPSGPRTKTIKKLFTLSWNQCAMPDCETNIVDTATDAVIGEICHIKGSKPSSPRYDASQSDEARHGFENLVILCGVHHKIVDDNEGMYSVEILEKIKKEHEARSESCSINEKAVEVFYSSYLKNNVSGTVESHDQSGGQTALVINNYHADSVNERATQLARNLELKSRLKKGLLKNPKDVNIELLRNNPPEKFRSGNVIIRSVCDTSYPGQDTEPDGISGWFKLEIWDFYHNGLEFVASVEDAIVDADGRWGISDFERKDESFEKVRVLKIFQIPFDNIVQIDLDGDEYYPQPHLYCSFSNDGEPYEDKRYVMAHGIPWALSPDRRIDA